MRVIMPTTEVKLPTTIAGKLQMIHDMLFEPIYCECGNQIGEKERDPPILSPEECMELLNSENE